MHNKFYSNVFLYQYIKPQEFEIVDESLANRSVALSTLRVFKGLRLVFEMCSYEKISANRYPNNRKVK